MNLRVMQLLSSYQTSQIIIKYLQTIKCPKVLEIVGDFLVKINENTMAWMVVMVTNLYNSYQGQSFSTPLDSSF
jgi:hypothetical protein